MKRLLPFTFSVLFSFLAVAQTSYHGVNIHAIEFVDKPSALDRRFYAALAFETPNKAWVKN